MFRGEISHSIDAKGRIVIPTKFRSDLGDQFIITKGLGKCLFVFTLNDWTSYEQKVQNMPISDADLRRFVRFFFGSAHDAETDSNGRVLIPQNLRDYAGLDKDIISLGLPGRIEIWGKENWDEYNGESNFVDDDLASKMFQLGI